MPRAVSLAGPAGVTETDPYRSRIFSMGVAPPVFFMPCAVYRIRVIVPHALFRAVAILQRFQRSAVRVGVAGNPDERTTDFYVYAGERDNRGHGTREILCGFGGVAGVCGAVGACPDVAQPLESFFVLRREILEKRRSVAVGVRVRVELLAERTVGFFEFVESSAGVKVASHDIPPMCAPCLRRLLVMAL